MPKRPMTDEERALVEANLDIVHWVIKDNIGVRPYILGLEYYDLAQEGYLLLIKAARTYQESRGTFEIFARIVVRTGLYSYCRRANKRYRALFYQTHDGEDGDEDALDFMDTFISNDDTAREVDAIAMTDLLESFLPKYKGVSRKGIEAIILKIQGFSGSDIAEMYNVDKNNIGAWISRAKEKLLANKRFMENIRDFV